MLKMLRMNKIFDKSQVVYLAKQIYKKRGTKFALLCMASKRQYRNCPKTINCIFFFFYFHSFWESKRGGKQQQQKQKKQTNTHNGEIMFNIKQQLNVELIVPHTNQLNSFYGYY